jgi:hypothetical protein
MVDITKTAILKITSLALDVAEFSRDAERRLGQRWIQDWLSSSDSSLREAGHATESGRQQKLHAIDVSLHKLKGARQRTQHVRRVES